MIRKYLTVPVLLAVFAVALAAWQPTAYAQSSQQPQDEFDEFVDSMDLEFEDYVARMNAEYDAYAAQQDSLFDAYVREIDKLWNDHVYPSKKEYVEYSDGYHARLRVDFEVGKVQAEVLVEGTSETDIRRAKTELKAKLTESITTAGTKEPYKPVETGQVEPPAEETLYPPVEPPPPAGPMLADLIEDASGRPVDSATAARFIEEAVTALEIKVDTVVSQDGKRRYRLSAGYELVPDHLKRMAEKYLPEVEKYARQYNLDVRLVLAIMHTESYFNPRATSRVPAYGLMQIVPKTAGRDAFKKVFGEDKLVTKEYLYDAQNNIQLGCAYLNVVRFSYMKGIPDDQRAYPCAIAAYNGGIGTVAKAMSGSNSLSALASAATEMDSERIVSKLQQRLPYKETRDYLNNVLKRMAYYDEWAK